MQSYCFIFRWLRIERYLSALTTFCFFHSDTYCPFQHSISVRCLLKLFAVGTSFRKVGTMYRMVDTRFRQVRWITVCKIYNLKLDFVNAGDARSINHENSLLSRTNDSEISSTI